MIMAHEVEEPMEEEVNKFVPLSDIKFLRLPPGLGKTNGEVAEEKLSG